MARHLHRAGLVKSVVAKLKDPKTLGGIILGAVALAFLLSFSDIHKVGAAFTHFPLVFVPIVFGLIVCREIVRVIEWHYLLKPVRVHANWRHTAEALIAGDAGQILPAGIFLQNYILRQTEEADVARSLAATIAMQYLEAAVSLIVLAIVPVPGWWWLRPAAIVVLIGGCAFLFALTRKRVLNWIEDRGSARKFSGWISHQIQTLLKNMEGLGDPWVVVRAIALTGVYLAFTIATLYVITLAYHIPNITWLSATVIYCFVLVVIVLNPLPSDWGVSEGLGTAMFIAFGVKPAEGLTMMLILRFTIIFSTFVLTGAIAAIYREDVREVAEGPPIDVEPEDQASKEGAQNAADAGEPQSA